MRHDRVALAGCAVNQ